MANYPGTPNNDLLQGTTADDVYTNLGVGVDNVKDPGGKNTIDISSATAGAIVDLSPGQTSTLATGSFTLGSLIVGNNPDVVFVADISGSTSTTAIGVSVGDLNNDALPNTVLDGEIAGFTALNQSLIDRGLGDTARVSLIAFSGSAAQVGTTITPKTDANGNGIYDIVESLRTLQSGGSTNYEAALAQTQAVFTRLGTPAGKGNLVFLSDGVPDSTTAYIDEVAALKTSGYNLRAFGVGTGIPLAPLQSIDPAAATFTTTDELVRAFTLQGGTGSSTETSIETFIGTNFDDNISGNILSNNISAGAGNDIIAGVNPKAVNPGIGEIDTLTGGTGKDTFVLGDGSKVYYEDINATTPGLADYALITDFNTSQGDLVKLSGPISQYSLDNSPIAGISGQALFLNKPIGEPRELIAIFQNSTGLTVDSILAISAVTIASGVNAAEPATNGTFTLTRTGDLATALTVNLAAPTGTATSGVDYTAIATTATFAVGSATATVNVAPIDDTIVESTETISLALAAGNGYTLGATTAASINLTDNDVAPIVLPIITIASGVNAAEPATNGTFTLTRTGDLATALTVNLAAPTGTATSATDYTAIATTATFAVGSATATVNVAPIDDTIVEPTETISLALAAGNGYTLGATTAASINLTDNDVAPIVLPIITIASGIDAAEPATNGSFTLTRTGDLAAALTVNLAASTGSATSGIDYTAFAPTVTFAVGSATATVNVLTIDDLLVEPTETVGLVLAAGTGYTLGAVPNAPIDLVDNDVAVAAPQLEEQNHHCLHIKGGTDKSVLKFTKPNHQGKNKNQVCAFVVDDATGKIGSINPGHKDYLAAAIDRAQVVFSSLSDSPTDNGFDRDSQRHLNFKSGEHVEFMMIADDTLSRVKTDLAANKTPTNVLFSIPEANGDSSTPAKFTALPDGGYQIDWEDGATETTASTPDFNDMVMRVEVLNDPTTPVGIDIQNQSQGSVMDFRSSAGKTLKVDTKCESDAAYNNNIGFYAVEDSQGTLANGLKPGDMGYAEAAIKGAILRCFKTDVKTDLAVEGGKIYAPVVIANGTFEDYLKTNPQNQASGDIHAYFNYIGANTDNVDHFRLLGDNKFGVEDLYGGGDKDYNDVIFQMNIKS
jgi:hypothetical protein